MWSEVDHVHRVVCPGSTTSWWIWRTIHLPVQRRLTPQIIVKRISTFSFSHFFIIPQSLRYGTSLPCSSLIMPKRRVMLGLVWSKIDLHAVFIGCLVEPKALKQTRLARHMGLSCNRCVACSKRLVDSKLGLRFWYTSWKPRTLELWVWPFASHSSQRFMFCSLFYPDVFYDCPRSISKVPISRLYYLS